MADQTDALTRQIGDFAGAILRFVRRLPREMAADSIIRQVARSAGSVSANYRAACSAASVQESITRLGVAVEAVDDTDHWLWMAVQLRLGNSQELARLAAEAKDLHAGLSASLTRARRNSSRAADARRTHTIEERNR
jgi:four helix bundle protein